MFYSYFILLFYFIFLFFLFPIVFSFHFSFFLVVFAPLIFFDSFSYHPLFSWSLVWPLSSRRRLTLNFGIVRGGRNVDVCYIFLFLICLSCSFIIVDFLSRRFLLLRFIVFLLFVDVYWSGWTSFLPDSPIIFLLIFWIGPERWMMFLRIFFSRCCSFIAVAALFPHFLKFYFSIL